MNHCIRRLDISCNFIDDSTASTLIDAIDTNTNIIELDIRNNSLSEPNLDEVKDIITKNMLSSKKIPYKKLGDCI